MQADFPALEVRETGDLSLDDAIDDRVADDLSSAETLSLPITLILMLLAFGALIAAGIPVLLAGTSVAATIGILAPVSHLVHADSTVTSMIVLIGMAVGVDYSLFYLKREREERAKGHSSRDAVEIAAQTSGHSILVSGAAVDLRDGRAVPASATRRSTRWPSARSSSSRSPCSARSPCCPRCSPSSAAGSTVRGCRCCTACCGAPSAARSAAGCSARSTKHPLVALALATVVVVLLAIPALGMKTHSANLETLPSSIPEAQTAQDLSRAFPSEGTTADLVVKADAGQQAEVAAALAHGGGRRRGVAAVPAVRAPRPGLAPTARSRCSPWRCRSTSPTAGSTPRSRTSAPTLAPAALDG